MTSIKISHEKTSSFFNNNIIKLLTSGLQIQAQDRHPNSLQHIKQDPSLIINTGGITRTSSKIQLDDNVTDLFALSLAEAEMFGFATLSVGEADEKIINFTRIQRVINSQ